MYKPLYGFGEYRLLESSGESVLICFEEGQEVFAFVTSIRHPDTSKNYERVLDVLRLTVNSVLGQCTREPFLFVVVCNKRPVAFSRDERLIFLEVDFPPADGGKGPGVNFDALKIDKGAKISVGLLFLKKFDPKYVFIIDADDWVNRRTIEYVSDKEYDLIYANSGYLVDFLGKKYYRKFGMCRYCGSTYIYKYKSLMDISGLSHNGLLINSGRDQFTEMLDSFMLKNILGNHRHQISLFKRNGLRVKQASIPLVSWVTNNGENHSGSKAGKFGIPISRRFAKEFSVDVIGTEDFSVIGALVTTIDALKSLIGWALTNKRKNKI